MGRSKKANTEKAAVDGKAAFQVRLDTDVHEKLKTAAAVAGISMNQLIQGVLRWAGDHVRQGRPTLVDGVIGEEPCSECVWFGHLTRPIGMGDRGHQGQFVFLLDYSDRKALSTTLYDGETIDGEFFEGDNAINDGDERKNFEARIRAAEAERAKAEAAAHSSK